MSGRRWMRNGGVAGVTAGVLLVVATVGATHRTLHAAQRAPGDPAQQQRQTPYSPPGTQTAPVEAMPDPLRDKLDNSRKKAMDDDRHKRLEADADKLLQLATELKAEVDKTSKDQLSVVVVKKAGEMEKLSRDLKERMRN